MKKILLHHCFIGVVSASLLVSPAWARGFGGASGGRGGGGGNFHGGGGNFGGGGMSPGGNRGGGSFGGGGNAGGRQMPSGGFGGGGRNEFGGSGASGNGFRPSSQSPNINRSEFGGMGGQGGGMNRPNVVHPPGPEGGSQFGGNRPQIQPGGGITRPDIPGRTPGGEGMRPGQGGAGTNRFPGLGGAGEGPRPGEGGAGTRLPFDNRPGEGGNGAFPGMRPGEGGAGTYHPNGPGHYPYGPYGPHPYGPGPAHYPGWYHGYAPAWGNGRWNYLWDSYPVAMGLGVTMWGVNTASWMFGVGTYVNPYCDGPVYVNNQPIVNYTQPIVDTSASQSAESQPIETPSDSADSPVNLARQAFFDGNYTSALNSVNQALVTAPNDAALNEFRSLCLFALGQYRDSAATIHSVLAAGPGWNWTTMISLYSDSNAYTEQLRKLEKYVKDNPQAADAQFLLGYHYLTMDHPEDAVMLWKSVIQLQPNDQLAADLVKMYSPAPAPTPGNEQQTEQAQAALNAPPSIPLEKLYGDWTARANDGTFSLHLGDDKAFTWKFTRDGQPQGVSGTFSMSGSNLVLQPENSAPMISTVSLKNANTLEFTPIGETQKLTFNK